MTSYDFKCSSHRIKKNLYGNLRKPHPSNFPTTFEVLIAKYMTDRRIITFHCNNSLNYKLTSFTKVTINVGQTRNLQLPYQIPSLAYLYPPSYQLPWRKFWEENCLFQCNVLLGYMDSFFINMMYGIRRVF